MQAAKMNNNESKVYNNELVSNFRALTHESHINFPMTDDLLLCFLRSRKFEMHRALKLLKNYIKMVKNYPELFTNLRVARLKHVFDRDHLLIPSSRDQNGRRVLILNARDWDYNVISLDDMYSAFVLCFQMVVADVDNQVRGVVLVLDFKGFSLDQVKQFTPSFVKKLADLIQNVFPIRFAGIHVVNEPWVLKILVSMIWPFLSYKIRSRLFFHGKCFEILHQHVDPICLPTELDGDAGPMSTLHCLKEYPEEKYSQIFDCFN